MTRPSRGMSPAEAWAALREGNERFVRGEMAHPSQDAGQRAKIAGAQYPFAVIFGCSDSRVAAEIIFDQGLGDVFVVRTAGHLSLIHISEPTRPSKSSRMPSSA